VNRRFVSFYFDLSDDGAAADPIAREFVTAARPALDADAVATPKVLLMTPAGRVVGEIDPFLGAPEFLQQLLEVLRAQPEFARASPEELALTDPVERARLALDLRDLGEAKLILARTEGSPARYLAGHIARIERDFATMEAEFARVDAPELADDVRVERAQRAWLLGDYTTLVSSTADFPAESERCNEALYLRGLGLFHLGSRDEALAQWRELILERVADAWVYRADWAYTELQQGKLVGAVGTTSARSSPLGRIGYIGRGNPDLLGP